MDFKSFWHEFKKEAAMKAFTMIRQNDESGTSGTGHVLDGVMFPSGKVVVCWDPDNANTPMQVNSVAVYDNWEQFYAVHVGQHPTNGTKFNWYTMTISSTTDGDN